MGTAAFCILLAFVALESSHARVRYPNYDGLTMAMASNPTSAVKNYVNVFLRDDDKPITEDSDDDNGEKPPTNEMAADGNKLQAFKNLHILSDPRNYTHHVLFFSKASFELLCQGALINRNWVVTSATCLKRYSEALDGVAVITSMIQKDNIQANDIKRVVLYPDFEYLTNQNDIALVETEEPVKLKETITSTVEVSHDKRPVNPYCGFTSLYNHTMMGMVVDFVTENYCMRSSIPKQKLYYFCAGINGRQINLGENNVLGSPLLCDGKLVGIKSVSTIFSSVSEVADWIDSVVKGVTSPNQNDLQELTKSEREHYHDFHAKTVPPSLNDYNPLTDEDVSAPGSRVYYEYSTKNPADSPQYNDGATNHKPQVLAEASKNPDESHENPKSENYYADNRHFGLDNV